LKPLFTIGDQGPTIGKPRAAAVDGAGNIYIFTEVDSKIHKFDPKGNELTSWYVHDAGGKPLVEASALVVKDNNIMLFDSNSSSMLVYSPDGKESGRVLMCACFFARGASLARDGNLWIANTGGSQVLKISPTGQQLEALGDKGSEPGKFIEPASVWEAQDGTLYVADVGNKRVQSFTPNHKPLAQWDMGQSVARDGNRLVGDSQGNVIVTELVGTAIVKYDKQGKELGRWYYSRGGSALVPAGIAALGDDKFIMLFQEGNLAAVFSLK
jgi:sugar lactone lactonase YvrE